MVALLLLKLLSLFAVCTDCAGTFNTASQLAFPFGSRLDSNLPPNDDDAYAEKCLSPNHSFRIFNEQYQCLFVNNNGIITSDQQYEIYNPAQFSKVTEKLAIIAPFWTDIDTRQVGTVYYRNTAEDADLAKADELVREKSDSFRNFKAREVLVVTWDHVGFYTHHLASKHKTNTFQCALIVGADDDTFVLFSYSNMTWTFGDTSKCTQVGYTTADRKHTYEHPWSLTDDIINITNSSNVGVAGVWVFHLGEDKRFFKQDTDHKDVIYLEETIEEVITSDEVKKVVIGTKEDLGITVSLDTGTVPDGEKLTLIIEAVAKVETETTDPSTGEEGVAMIHDSVSSIYALQKSDVVLLKRIKVTIAHSAALESEEEKKNMEFLLFRLPAKDSLNSKLIFVGVKKGVFLETHEGDQIGIVELENSDLEFKVFIEIARKILLSPLMSQAESQRKKPKHMYSARFYKSKKASLNMAAVFCMCRNDAVIKRIAHNNIVKGYSGYSIEDSKDSYAEKRVSFEADHVNISHTLLPGVNIISSKNPVTIEKSDVDDFSYTNVKSLEDDPDFPPSLYFSISLDDNSPEGVCYFSSAGLKKDLSFSLMLFKRDMEFNACLPNPCQNGGTCSLKEDSRTLYTCQCESDFAGLNCDQDVSWNKMYMVVAITIALVVIVLTTIVSCYYTRVLAPDAVGKVAPLVTPETSESPLRNLLRDVEMTEEDLNHEITTKEQLHRISMCINDWEYCAVPLGLTQSDINAIKLDPTTTVEVKRRAALNKWKSKLAHLATYRKLVDVFLDNKDVECARKVCNLRKAALNESGAQEIHDLW